MSKILVIGNATLDIVHSVAHFPQEDEELRATAQRFQRGGNAANTACVLAQHGHQVSYAGTLARDAYAQIILDDLAEYGIDLRYCQRSATGASPLSCITHNQQSGSRTIVHYRDLDEYAADRFADIPLTEYDWFHFEGRNVEQTCRMLEQLHQVRVDQPISIEIEKPRAGIEKLFGYADVLLYSRAYAQASGFATAAQLFTQLRQLVRESILICSWGEAGAFASSTEDELLEVAAEPVAHVVDSVGAGDTFHAGVIHALLSGQRLPAALVYANQLAARKLRQHGFQGLAT